MVSDEEFNGFITKLVSDLEKSHREKKVFIVKTERIDEEEVTNGPNSIGISWKGTRYIIEVMDPRIIKYSK